MAGLGLGAKLVMTQATVSKSGSIIDIDATFLPVGRMRQITRVTAAHTTGIEGVMDLGQDHWVYPEHFPGDPIFPGTLLIEAAGQLVALFAWWEGRRGYPRLVRTQGDFRAPVSPAVSVLELKACIQRKRHLYFGDVEILAEGTLVAAVSVALGVLAPR